MSDVRINGNRFPALQAVDSFSLLLNRVETLADSQGCCVTNIHLNGRILNIDSPELMRLRLEPDDRVEVRMETHQQMAFECVQVALEMSELLIFDLKVATLHLWENTRMQEKSLEALLQDCQKFLTLAAEPVQLLGENPHSVSPLAKQSLMQLDTIAKHLEDVTLLAVSGARKEACQVLVARVKPAIEKWMGLSASFVEQLEIDTQRAPKISQTFVSGESNSPEKVSL